MLGPSINSGKCQKVSKIVKKCKKMVFRELWLVVRSIREKEGGKWLTILKFMVRRSITVGE